MITVPSNPQWWLTRDGVAHAAAHLRYQFALRYPVAAETVANDPAAVCDHMDDVELLTRAAAPPGGCVVGGVYSPEHSPARITIRVQGNRRDGFTVLHEVAHHLMHTDDEWSLTVRPTLPQGKDRITSEKVANSFAASVILPANRSDEIFTAGVTAEAIRELYQVSEASATACLVHGLDRPGQRLVLLTNHHGLPWFADSHGTPFNPGRRITQPLIANAVERADTNGLARLTGGEGIHYSTARADTDLTVDIAIEGGLVFAVATSTPHDTRITTDYGGQLLCAHCEETHTPGEGAGHRCPTCAIWPCPACGQCDCERPATVCGRCFIQLPQARAKAGNRICEECS